MPRKAAVRSWTHELTMVGMDKRVTKDGRLMLQDMAEREEFKVRLEREPTNRWDENAIKVIYDDPAIPMMAGRHIGYVPRETAALLAPMIDSGALGVKRAECYEVFPANGTFRCIVTFLDFPVKRKVGRKA